MYKVMIIEDETTVRRGIVLTIDWFSLGCMIVGEAANGEEGLELVLRLSPDIVVTDVKMPRMDGVEMIQKLRQAGCRSRFIILTAYSDFKYAQSALRLGVNDYLLKPLKDGELEEAVRTLVRTASGSGTGMASGPGGNLVTENLAGGNQAGEGQGSGNLAPWGQNAGSQTPWSQNAGNLAPWGQDTRSRAASALESLAAAFPIYGFRTDRTTQNRYVEAAIRYIHCHYQEDISISTVSHELEISEGYLSRMFKKETNYTFTNYLIYYRLRLAMELLMDCRMKVYEVADRVGYSDTAYFSAQFKKIVGLSPSEYQGRVGSVPMEGK